VLRHLDPRIVDLEDRFEVQLRALHASFWRSGR
jgi:hypothetical protein